MAAKIEPAHAVGLLVSLWTWALRMAEQGELTDFPLYAVANAAGWRKKPEVLIEALLKCGWLDRENDKIFIHDWFDYAGRLIEKRQENTERVRRWRKKKEAGESGGNAESTQDCGISGGEFGGIVTHSVTRNKCVTLRGCYGATVPNPTQPYPTQQNRTRQDTTIPNPTPVASADNVTPSADPDDAKGDADNLPSAPGEGYEKVTAKKMLHMEYAEHFYRLAEKRAEYSAAGFNIIK